MFIDRYPSGEPRGLFAVRQHVGQEEIDIGHPDVAGFLGGGLVWDNGWRPKTEAELSAEKDAKAADMADVKNVALAILEAVFDMKQNPGNYTTDLKLKQKALQNYRVKL